MKKIILLVAAAVLLSGNAFAATMVKRGKVAVKTATAEQVGKFDKARKAKVKIVKGFTKEQYKKLLVK